MLYTVFKPFVPPPYKRLRYRRRNYNEEPVGFFWEIWAKITLWHDNLSQSHHSYICDLYFADLTTVSWLSSFTRLLFKPIFWLIDFVLCCKNNKPKKSFSGDARKCSIIHEKGTPLGVGCHIKPLRSKEGKCTLNNGIVKMALGPFQLYRSV